MAEQHGTTGGASVVGSPLSHADVDRIRAALPVLERGGRYLNAGTLGPLPRPAVAAMEAELGYDVGLRQSVDLWDRIVDASSNARAAVASLVGSEPDQVALMHSTHEGVNTALWGIDWRVGDQLVTTDQEHPAAAVPMRHVRDRMRVDLRVVRWDGDTAAEELAAKLADACSARTRAVLISHVSWLTGAIAPLRAIRNVLPSGVQLIVDGAQAGGIVPTTPADGWDAYTISGQKWPCGPNGTGGLVLRDPEAWLPMFGGATQVESSAAPFDSGVVRDGRRFETSQTAMVPLLGLTASVRWLQHEAGPQRAYEHATAMNAYARTVIAERLGAGVVRHLHGRHHLLAVELDALDASLVVRALWDAGIQISAPIAQRRVRFSFGPWTNMEDVDAGIDALVQALDELG